MTKNFLDSPKLVKLGILLIKHGDEINEGKWTYDTFAKYAQKELGFRITRHNVIGAMAKFCEDEDFAFQKTEQGLKIQKLWALTRAVSLLAQELIELRTELGEAQNINPELTVLATKLQPENQE